MLDLYEEALALIRALEDDGVPYALCGALALAVHGAPRATADIDLLVGPDAVARVLDVAKGLGFTFGAAPMGFRDGVTVHRWSKLSEGEVLTVDVLEAPPGYEPILAGRVRASIGEHALSVVSRDGLIQMKLWAARSQDVADVEKLQRARPVSVDMSPDAIRARLRAACPPDLRPEHRLDYKVDMSPAGIRARLRQASEMLRLCRALSAEGPKAS